MPTKPRRGASGGLDQPPSANLIPPIYSDPEASLAPASLEIELLGQVWTVPPLPAAEWLTLLWADAFDPDAIFPGLAGAEEAVFDAMLDGLVTPNEVFEVAMEVLELAAGYRWWFTIKLAMQAKAAWSRVGGLMLLKGVDPNKVSLGAWCSALLALCLNNMEQQKAADFILELNTPPVQYAHLAEEEDGKAFLAAMNQSL